MADAGNSKQVVAVSVAQPQWVDVRGRSTFTSIVREPSAVPVYFGAAGPAGNQTAVHTEQVYAFIAEHYDYWTAELRIERKSWDWCHWGENITFRGLSEAELHIGDQLRVGGAVLRVTSPRIPCYKLAWRVGQPDSFLRTLIQSGRMGSYLQVMQPGFIGAGDSVEMLPRTSDTVSLADLGRLLFDDTAQVSQLSPLLGMEALGSQAAGMIRSRISHLRDGDHSRRGRWRGWRAFKVDELPQETADIRSMRLSPVDGDGIAGYRAGQFLTLRLPPLDGDSQVRTWSISEFNVSGDSYRVSVKRAAGPGSRWVHEFAQPGAIVEVRPPAGAFVLDRSGILRVVMISAGVGITPMISMLAAHADLGADAPPLLWIHSTTNGRTHAFRDETRALLTRLPQVEQQVHYTQPDTTDVKGVDYDAAGRITSESIERWVRGRYTFSPFGRPIEVGGDNATFYVCGTSTFMSMVSAALLQSGAPAAAIRQETFAPTHGDAGLAELPDESVVCFAKSKREIRWHRDDSMTLLELAESAGLQPEFGCRMGACQTCDVALVDGEVQHEAGVAGQPGPGRALLCCSRPRSARIAIDL